MSSLQSHKRCNESTNDGNGGSVCFAVIDVPDYKFELGQEPTQIFEHVFSQELNGSRINTNRGNMSSKDSDNPGTSSKMVLRPGKYILAANG
jgi:hypothetical protein